jgi:hypothetical protein
MSPRNRTSLSSYLRSSIIKSGYPRTKVSPKNLRRRAKRPRGMSLLEPYLRQVKGSRRWLVLAIVEYWRMSNQI